MSDEQGQPATVPAGLPLDRQVEELWQQGRAADVHPLLAAAGPVPPADLAQALALDQWHRWHAGECVSAEDYLRRYPALEASPESALELIYGEFLVREQLGDAPRTEEFLHRFPKYADRLSQQFRLHRGLEGGGQSRATALAEAEATLDQPAARAGAAALGGLPRRVGRYLIQEQIAQGGMGAVLRVHDPDFQRTLAVKILLPWAAGRPEARRRFLEEAKVTGQLQHPGIPPVHELGTLEDGSPFFAMKLIQGRTLAELLGELGPGAVGRDRPLAIADLDPRLLGVFRQVCQTVAYAHSRGILHRDLKPSNVMVGAFGEVQVMDWGLAKVLTPASGGRPPPVAPLEQGADAPRSPTGQTQAGTVMGTPGYMAPEQARGEIRTLDERCDVFGLGALLCELLTGRPPFRQADSLARLRATAAGDLAEAFGRLDGCGADPDLVALARRCLAPGKEERPRQAGEVAEAVERHEALVQERLRQAELQRKVAQVQAAEERRRRRATLLAATAAVLLVCGAAVAALWFVAERGARASRHEVREQGIRDALGQARQARAELHARLSRPGGVFRLLNRPADWLQQIDSARFALRRAQDLAAGAEIPVAAELRQQLEDLHSQLGQDEAERGLALKLDKVRDDRSAWVEFNFDDARAEREYPAVFEQAGLAVVPGQEAKLAALVEKSRIREQLLAALDDWAFVAWHRAMKEKGKKALQRRLMGLQRRLLRVTRQADPDPWKDQVREPALWNKPQAMKRLAEKARAEPKALSQLSPQLLNLLGELLREGEEARSWLRQGVALHPSDFWLNFTLGNALRKSRPPQAEGFFRAALAVRPQNVMAHNNLGIVLREQKDLEGAVRHYRKALALDANFAPAHINLGNVLREQKDLKGAVQHFKKALELVPSFALIHNNLGNALRDLKDLEGAVAHFKKALAIDPNYAPAHINLGNALQARKDLEGALGHYRKALELDPHSAPAHTNLGNVLREQKDLKGAIEHYQKALELDPNFAPAHSSLGHALRQQQDLKGAMEHFKRALDLDPEDARAHTTLGNALREQKNLKGAIAHYRRALALDPCSAPVHNNLSVALREQKDLEGAVAHCKKALALDPKFALAHYNLGMALYERGDLKGAIGHYQKALALDPNDAAAHNNLGHALQKQNDLEGAFQHFKRALELSPRSAPAHNNLGVALRERKDLAGAVRHYQKALELDPNFAPAHNNLGSVLQEQKDFRGALRHFERALELDPKDATAHTNLGVALRHQKDLAGAVRHFQKALALDPNFAPAHAKLGMALYAQRDFKRAVQHYQKALELDPPSAPAHTNLGMALYAQRDIKGAVGHFKKALALDPNFVPAHFNLGNVLRDRKDFKGAIGRYQKALELDPNYAPAHNNLGNVLRQQQDLEGAVAHFKKARDLEPRSAPAHTNLGMALYEQRDLKGAAAACRRAIELDPQGPNPRLVMGLVLKDQGDFLAATGSFRRILELLPPDQPMYVLAQRGLKQCRQLLALEKRLPLVLRGEKAAAAEKRDLADLCWLYKQRYTDAAKLYAAAFADEPGLADDLKAGSRYRAACAAARAAGPGSVKEAPADGEKMRLRKQALTWLRADLQAWRKTLPGGPAVAAAVRKALELWRSTPDLAGVRDEKALGKLPAEERNAWRQLWADVNQLRRQARPVPAAPR